MSVVLNGTLFMHGMITNKNFGFIPSKNKSHCNGIWPMELHGTMAYVHSPKTLHKWIDKLNNFVQEIGWTSAVKSCWK